jgi:hypothetical protein
MVDRRKVLKMGKVLYLRDKTRFMGLCFIVLHQASPICIGTVQHKREHTITSFHNSAAGAASRGIHQGSIRKIRGLVYSYKLSCVSKQALKTIFYLRHMRPKSFIACFQFQPLLLQAIIGIFAPIVHTNPYFNKNRPILLSLISAQGQYPYSNQQTIFSC